MRIRTIKPEFFLHEGLFEAERATKLPLRLAFAGLWCAADREGRFKWEPRRLGVQILPYDNADFARVLDALATRGFIRKYALGTAEYGVIPSFTRIKSSTTGSVSLNCLNLLQCWKIKGLTRAARVMDATTTECLT